MKLFTEIDSIDKHGGRFLVLTDYGYEGIRVTGQFETIEEAIMDYGSDYQQAIVMIPDIQFSLADAPIKTALDDEAERR